MAFVDTLHRRGIGVHPRLGAGPLPPRPARARLLRRHPPLRARRPARARAARLGHAASSTTAGTRSPTSSSATRSSGSSATTWTACGWTRSPRCSTSTTRSKAGRVGAERPRRPREPRGDRLPPAVQRGRLRHHPGVDDHRRGVDRPGPWSRGPSYLGRARLRAQVEHGLDARRARLHAPRRRCTGSTTTTSSRSGCSTPGTRTSSCRCPTTRWSTARARCIAKMPGDDWQRFANLRAALRLHVRRTPARSSSSWAASSARPASGTTTRASTGICSSMGPYHRGLQRLVRDLNRLYRAEPALHQVDFEPAGFEWMDCADAEQSVVAFVRRARDPRRLRARASATSRRCRATATASASPSPGFYREALNTDGGLYGGEQRGQRRRRPGRARSPGTASPTPCS